MNAIVVKKIDELIIKIKNKADMIGMTSADLFIILTLEILRGELINEKLTELTIKACNEISATTSHFYYFGSYPELYTFLHEVFNEIFELDPRFFSADIGTIGFDISDWQNYLSQATKEVIGNTPKEYSYKKSNHKVE